MTPPPEIFRCSPDVAGHRRIGQDPHGNDIWETQTGATYSLRPGGTIAQPRAVEQARLAQIIGLPTRAFARGSIVRHRDSANHMLCVRSGPDKTACVVVESDHRGDLRFRDFVTAELIIELESAIPAVKEALHVET